MLEVIIKRDGSEENFDSRKANKWLLWAGHDLVNRIDWVGIVMRAIENAPTVMSSQDFQLALIKGCLDQSDWPHNLLAGRLYAAYLRKKLFDDVIPSVQELHTKLQGLGLMIDMGYSAAEYNAISTFIDHDRDFDMAHFQLAHDHSKYSISNRTTGQVYETPQFVAMRMAMHICKDVEDAKERLEHVKVFYDNYSKGSVSSPSPNYSNLGTHNRGLASCCLIAAGDSAVSLAIANHIVFTMTYKSAGEGLSLGCRSILDEVRGGAISHNGKLPYLSSFGKAVKANKQGSRSGALTVHVSVYDPEITDIIMLQNPRTPLKKQNRDMHVSVMDNFFFAWKAARREQYFTFNVHTAPDLYHAQFSSDRQRFIDLYNKYENDPSFKKNYLDAYDVVAMLESQGHEVSTAYNLDIGESNTHTSFKEPILSSNLCVAPETPILTKEYGYRAISELKDQEVHVWNGEQWSKTTVRQTGTNQRLLTVRFKGSLAIDATHYHRWLVQTPDGVVIKETQHLTPGEMLVKCDFDVVDHGSERLSQPYEGQQWKNGDTQSMPDRSYCLSDRLEWFAGSADRFGQISYDPNGTVLGFYGIGRHTAARYKMFLQELGCDAHISVVIRETSHPDISRCGWDLLIDEFNLAKLIRLGFSPWVLDVSGVSDTAVASGKYVMVDYITDNDRRDDTYCFTEPLRNQGVFAGVLTMNCQEITQPTKPYESMKDLYSTEDHGRGEVSLCSLGGIPVPKFPLKKGHDAAYEQACYVAVVTADTCIDLSEYEFPHMEMTAKARRNIAIGMTGIAEYFARRGIKFDTPYGLEITSQLAERHLYYVIKASLRLAREKGNAPWIHKTKWPDGWLPLDTYKKSMDEYVPHVLHYDWEALRAEIVEQGGLRNSALVAHMPFESSSKRHAHPNGVYPIRELYLNKTDGANKLDWCAPDGDLIGADYQLAYDIAHMALMIYYGTLQKWADQSISADTYEDRIANPRISKDTLVERYLFRKKLGVKARYYGNSKLPSEGADSVLASQLNELNGVGELLTDMEPSGGICEGGACSC